MNGVPRGLTLLLPYNRPNAGSVASPLGKWRITFELNEISLMKQES
jgi:hypothetical protein